MATVFRLPPAESAFASPGQATAPAATPGLFRRVLLALMEARQRRADSEIVEILSRRGGSMAEAPGFRPVTRRNPGDLPG